MGNNDSKDAHEELFKSTAPTRFIMNKIFTFMMDTVKIQDFMTLSTEAECSKYVLFQANHLYNRFHELEVMPTIDKHGTILFETIKDLGTPSEEIKKQQQTLCLVVSYFFTRIFQIYGALALTLIDDIEVIKSSGIIQAMSKDTVGKLGSRGRNPVYIADGGGAYPTANPLDTFEFLRNYLTDLRYPGDSTFYQTTYRYNENLVGFRKRSEPYKGIFIMAYNKLPIQLGITSKSDFGQNTVNVEIDSSMTYTNKMGKQESISLPPAVLSHKKVTIVSTANQGYMVQRKDAEPIPVDAYFNELFSDILKHLKERGGQTGNSSSIGASETGVQEELRIHKIVHNLKYRKPLGHCIARGLQLLNTQPLKGQPGVSSICKAKFLETTVTGSSGTKTISSRSGIPEPGASLDTSPGLLALSNLFYDSIALNNKLEIGTTQLDPNQKPSIVQYKEFMTTMAGLFGQGGVTEKTKLSEIGNKRDRDECKGKTDTIPIPASDTNDIYVYVKQLFIIQLQHSAKCGAIFKLLFDYHYDPQTKLTRMALSRNIIKKGMTELNRINYLTRQTLIDYYSKCESTYIQGMGAVINLTAATKPGVNPATKPATNPPTNPATNPAKLGTNPAKLVAKLG